MNSIHDLRFLNLALVDLLITLAIAVLISWRTRFRFRCVLPVCLGVAVLVQWAELETSGRLAKLKETQLQGDFLSQVFGEALGSLYADKYGSVCMTEPHEPYHIGPEERDQWLLCMDRALELTGASEEVVAMLKIPLFRIADAVRNREGPSAAATNPNIIAAG